MELNKSVTELLRNFEMELIDPTVMKVYAAAVYLFQDLWVRVEKREVKI